VEADKARGTVKARGSHARNLDRLKNMVAFVSLLMQLLLERRNRSLKDAATEAYEKVLAPTHPWLIQKTVYAAMYLMPTKEHLLQQLGEESLDAAAPALQSFCAAANKVAAAIEGLYDEPIGRG
jgi:hypothetical protein